MAISYGTITITDLGSVTKVDVYYYVSTSATELSGGSWSTDAPAWSDNKYIWSKTVTTWEEGRTTESNPACITGAKGTTGQSGRSIQSIKEQYYLSTSSTSQVGGSWQDAMPTYVNGRYYWTHSIITWKEPNGSTTTETTTAVLAGALTSANSTAKSANDTANTANNTANAANNTANAANTTAGEAKSIAQEAQSTAGQALTTANNKNKTFYQDSQPTGGSYLDGDSWYDTNDDNKLYIYNGTSKKWVAQQFGNAAIADSSITNAKIANATIQSAKIISLEGAKIVANSITANQLATDAIKSNNYQASPNTSSPYSATGTFLDLSTGNIYTPNFGVDSVNGAAHINGQVIATSGQIGDSSTNYWQIGTYNDYNMNPSAAIIGNGTSYIQSGTWQISNNRINTQTYDGNNQITYIHYGSKYWDYGMKVPELDSTKSTYIDGVSNNWLYIRRTPSNTIPSLETDWEYLFRVDKDGTIYENGTKLSEKYASIDGVSGAYLPRSGGTITGNLTVNGTLTATASKANALTHTLSINGQSWSGSANLTINTLGVAYGGTGKTTGKDAANYFLNSLDIGSSTPVDGDYYISQYVGGGTTTTTYHRRPMSALWLYVKSKLSAADIYVPKTGGTFTGAVHVEDEFYGDSATLGNLIVNGNANFTNGLRATNINGGQVIYTVIGTQTATTAAWTGELPINELYNGLTIAYYLPRTSANNVTLKLTLANGEETAAIPVYVTSTTRMTTHYGAGSTILLTYWSKGSVSINGTAITEDRWTHGDYWNSNTVGEYGGSCIAGKHGMARYSLIIQTDHGVWESLVTTSTTATTKTKNPSGFLVTSPILYQNGGTYAEGGIAGYSSCWSVAQNTDTRYSFNVSNPWSSNGRSLYLVGTISGDKFTLKDTIWWADELPETNDGYYYWYVGQMASAYTYTLHPVHPIYYYDNGIKVLNIGALTSSQVTDALGYTPYNATNPNGYTTNKGTVTSVRVQASAPLQSSTNTAQGTTLDTTISFINQNKNLVLASPSTGNAGAPTFRGLVADDIPSLAWSKITSGNDDLKAIEALTGTSGFLKKTAANTWTLDTNTYLTGITSSQITTALGYTPYNATNPNGYTTNTGTVTKVTAGSGLKINTNTSGGDITTTGTINHINSVTAQTTQGLYPIKIDAQGHISAYGSAVTSWALSNITGADDLKAIEALSGTSGFLKKTAANTWSLDTTSYVPTTRKVNGHALSSDVTVTKGDVGLGNVTNYQQITGIGQGANGTLRVWTGDPTSTSTDDYTDVTITITAYDQSTVKKAVALDLKAAVGSTSKPVYFKADGKPYEIGYTIEKSVPSNAVFTDTTYTFDGTYNASTNKAATVSTVTNAINALDGGTIGTGGKGKTITSLSQSNGNVSATFADISITKSQISDFPTSMTPTAHTHDDRYYTESEIDNKFTALTNTTTQINNIKFYSGTCNAGKTYIGWIKIASVTMSNNNYIGENGYDIGIYRDYNSPAAESYNIKVNTGWGNASIVQLNGKAGTQIIEKFRLVKDNTNHIWYFEIYVNPTYSTNENLVNFRIQTWKDIELNLLNTVQTEADSDLQIVSTIDLKPQGIVSNSNFYGNLIGTADIANSVAWNNITSKPINFITNVEALNTNGWKTLGGRNTQSSIAISYASSNSATWNSGAFSSSIVFGCQDTKGMVDVGYTSPVVTFGGGSVNGSTDDAPKWYFKLNGTSGQSYTFPDASKTLAATDGSNASGSWGISITGNAATATSATSATKTGTSTIWLYTNNNNEINFGGTNTGTIIYMGYRATDSRPIPTKYVFGNSTGTADLQAKTVYLGSGTTSYISNTQYTGNAATATKATQDSDGNQINTTYLKLAGGTMTGVLNAKANQYEDAFAGALNMNNSNIYGVNSIYTADASDNSQEGIHFFRDTTHVDSIHAKSGVLYFTPNRALGTNGTSYSIYHTGNKPTKSDVGLGNVDNTADANKVVKGVSAIAGSADAYRHVWFSDSSTETVRNYDDDFKYNPSKNNLQVKNITGDSIQLTNWKIEEDSSTNSLMFRYVG